MRGSEMSDEQDAPERGSGDALRRALGAIRDLRARLTQAEHALHEPIAIVGMGCRFPGGASSPAAYWERLLAGRDLVSEVPRDRWDLDKVYDPDPDVPRRMYSRHGGFLSEPLQEFDARFFGISPREAESLDPQQRLLLETSWEALEHAGIAPTSLAGSDAGVFVGIGTFDYLQEMQAHSDPRVIDPYGGTGGGYCTASGRISYFLGAHGPNIAVDSACSSSLVSLLLAVQALRARTCSLALAGGVNAMLSPMTTMYMCNLRALSMTGRCATFDASADGYVRGEGAGMLVLKRLADAQRDGDTVHAIVRGGVFNHDGRSAGLTVPNGTAQRALIASALADAGVAPADVQYVEAHGTATQLGDPIELRALGAAYGVGREHALQVGSVKTNMGHLEAAAGVAGVIKCVLALQHGVIPQHLHLTEPSTQVDWSSLPIEVVTSARPWRDTPQRIAGVSSFGISGTIAHVLLEAAPESADDRQEADVLPTQLLPLSAVDVPALRAMAGNLAEALVTDELRLADVAVTLATGRAHFRERAVIVASDRNDAVRQLQLAAAGALDQIAAAGKIGTESPRIGFLFTGQGAQYAGMGAVLDASYPVFRAAIDRCAAVLESRLPMSLRELLFADVDGGTRLHETAFTQPAIFALEFALAELLASWGVRPRAVLGHSVGEYVAAVVAEALPLAAALTLVAERGRLMQSLPAGGAMGAIGLPEAEVRDLLLRHTMLDLAAVNSPSSCVVAGPEAAVLALINDVKTTGGDATRLSVSHAFHSRLMEPVLDAFTDAARGIVATEPSIHVVSNRTGDVIGAAQLADPQYWRDHLRGTVRFADGVTTLGRLGVDLIIEIGPTPALTGQARESLPGPQRKWLPTLRRGRDEVRAMAECAAGLFTAGVSVDWHTFHSAQRTKRIALPTYPWQRERFWKKFVTAEARAATTPTQWSHPLLGGRVSGPLPVFAAEIGLAAQPFLGDHRIFDLALFPASGYVELALAAAREVLGNGPVSVRNVALSDALSLPESGTVTVQVMLTPAADGTYAFRIFSRAPAADGADEVWREHASGELASSSALPPSRESLAAVRERCVAESDVVAYYAAMRDFSADYGPAFQGIVALHEAPGEALAEVRLPDVVRQAATSYRMHPALLDGCFQLVAAAVGLGSQAESGDDAYVPIGIGRVQVRQVGVAEAWCHVAVPAGTVPGQATVNCTVTVYDAGGAVVATIESLTVRRVSRHAIHAMLRKGVAASDGLYSLAWRVQSPEPEEPATPVSPGRWLILDDAVGTASAVRDTLHSSGHVVDLLRFGDSFEATDDGYQLNPSERSDVAHVCATARDECVSLRGVVLLWPHAVSSSEPTLESLDTTQQVMLTVALSFAQALDAAPVPLWIVTRGSQAFPGAAPDVAQATLWGLAGVITAENPAVQCVRIDLDPQSDPRDVAILCDALLQQPAEPTLAFRDGARLAPRLAPLTLQPLAADQAQRLTISERGRLENLTLATEPRARPAPDEVEIEVHAAGLNFRDVLNALGAYPGDGGALGNECAGIITAVGQNVRGLQVGDSVIALPQGGIATHVLAPASLTVRKPSSMSFAEAATVPVTFLTAYYALHVLGQVKPGDRVLIHAATGGVGMAAMQIALAAGARVVATAGSDAKRARAMEMGAESVADSRSVQFDETIWRDTNGEGVDIVLNALAGEFIPKSLRLLRAGGRFIEIGKTDVWDEARVAREYPGLGYHVFFLGALAAQQPDMIRELLAQLLADFSSGALAPLPQHVFALSEAESAFRFMAQARHTGKVVITPRHGAPLRADGTYLITGGLTGIGLLMAQSLVTEGARHVVLVGRRAPDAAAQAAIAALQTAGAQVLVASADVADPLQVAAMLASIGSAEMPPLRGVLHAAGVLDDAMLGELDWQRMSRVLAPKVAGSWNLHTQTLRDPLDFFVCFSSIAALLGSPGQGNYAAANQFLDSLAHARRAVGLPAHSVNWGSWAEIGMAAGLGEQYQRRIAASGLQAIRPEDGVRLLHAILRGAAPAQVAVLPLDTSALPSPIHPLLRELASPVESTATRDAASVGILARLREAGADERGALLEAMLSEQVMRVLAPDANYRPDAERSLLDLGMDSLMAIELRNRLRLHLELTIAVGDLMQGPTIRELAATVLSLLGALDDVSGEPAGAVAARESEDWESGTI